MPQAGLRLHKAKQQAKPLIDLGIAPAEIAARVKVSLKTIYKWMDEAGVKYNKAPKGRPKVKSTKSRAQEFRYARDHWEEILEATNAAMAEGYANEETLAKEASKRLGNRLSTYTISYAKLTIQIGTKSIRPTTMDKAMEYMLGRYFAGLPVELAAQDAGVSEGHASSYLNRVGICHLASKHGLNPIELARHPKTIQALLEAPEEAAKSDYLVAE
jgi:transposase